MKRSSRRDTKDRVKKKGEMEGGKERREMNCTSK